MDTLDKKKQLVNDTPNETNQEENNEIDELIIMYFFKFCSCPDIICYILVFLFFFFPLGIIIIYCRIPYKRLIGIDKKNKLLIIYNTGLIVCCKMFQKPYNLDNIEKIKLYIYSTSDPNVGFNKLYFINCQIYSFDGEKKELFGGIKYDKETFERYELFFKKYFETEIEPLEAAKDISEYNVNDQTNGLNFNDDDYPRAI